MMKQKHLFGLMAALVLLCACSGESDTPPSPTPSVRSADRLLVVCEGLWGMDNSSISLLDSTGVTNYWFQLHNPGMKLGDTGNDIVLVSDTMVAVCVNWSNIIQYLRPDGTAIAATEEIPNNRRMATDGRWLYVTSYANQGYVAKIDPASKLVVDTVGVGREPEGLAVYDGRLYVANSGGTSYKNKGYEQTVSVVDAASLTELRRIDTGCINLYGQVAQNGRWLCINSAGDYYNVKPQTVVLDMESEAVRVFDFPSTYSCTYGNSFYVIGSSYSYQSGTYEFTTHTIDLPSLTASEGLGRYAEAEATIAQMQAPYGLYISPYTGHLYVSDARSYVTNGYVYEFDADGKLLRRTLLDGINPAHFLALP